jgi:demethylmenaquinone methyltransferase / 2-methoxy-6-polyprenyl-1,4-benzoquinol methylase
MTAMSPLPEPARKREFVRDMFERIAPRYDMLNRLMSLGLDQRWRRIALTEAGVGRGDLVLDLACGTGDLAELAAERGARVIGVDFARAMLRGARERLPRLGFAQGDAARLPLRSHSANVIGCGFALRNFVDVDAVLAECARVLVPRGRLALLEVDAPRMPLLRALHALHFRGIVPRLGAWLADADAYRYLPASTVYLPEESDLRARLAKAGFATVRKRSLCFGAVQCVIAVRGA